ncbi:hypothetical protein GECvBN5_gp179 [Salmonella phage GEC_vB_N5]|uniref:Uncharacterized protein n=1 Tax=Salmonella phage GEC_vB_N5 TaxID=2777378 RepID=A0A7S9SRT3_9CAUD|nr:hypothetical protein GECvBN5_gp179 [Salmonella phage GEC_vB_N5]
MSWDSFRTYCSKRFTPFSIIMPIHALSEIER